MSDCVFCKIIAGALPAEVIWQDEEFLAFLDIRPVNPGHTLVIPKTHIDYLFDLDDDLYVRLFQAVKRLAVPIKTVMSAKRIGVAVEGFSVPHIHVHLIPVFDVGELDPNRATAATPDQLADIAAKIKPALK